MQPTFDFFEAGWAKLRQCFNLHVREAANVQARLHALDFGATRSV